MPEPKTTDPGLWGILKSFMGKISLFSKQNKNLGSFTGEVLSFK